jgi:hypothetical protein
MKPHYNILDPLTTMVLEENFPLEKACEIYMQVNREKEDLGPRYIIGIDGTPGSKAMVMYPFPKPEQISQEQFEKDVNYYVSLMTKENDPTLRVTNFDVIQ